MVRLNLNAANPFAILDLTEAYRDFASKSTRKVSLINQRSAFLIEDEFVLIKNTEVAWEQMTANSVKSRKEERPCCAIPRLPRVR
ncbi:MAG: hypothetical protein IPO07_29040 [Haliscomenobacter sp.]|nr:hypothetical protein [Haliscomenobacter sp.]MBK9492383.1 hypothetical protein [Haliscomenobacter sp.]